MSLEPRNQTNVLGFIYLGSHKAQEGCRRRRHLALERLWLCCCPSSVQPGAVPGQCRVPRPGHTSPGPALPSLAAATAHGHAGIPFPDCRHLHFPLCHSQKQWRFKYQQWQRQFLGLSVFWYQFEAIFEAEGVSVWQPPLMFLSCKGSPSDCCSHLPALMGTPRPGMESTKELLFEMQP